MPPEPEPWSFFQWFRFLRFFAGGAFLIFFGIWWMTTPSFRANPDVIKFEDMVPGLGVVFGGLVLLGLSALIYRR
jgi:hypothetical protein